MKPSMKIRTTRCLQRYSPAGRIPSLLIAFALAYFALCPMTQAVVPPPDGGYAGGNTAEGQAALFSLSTGTFNTAVGLFSLRSNTTGSENTAIGAGALLLNTESRNTATGAGALLSNATGNANVAAGVHALLATSPVTTTAIGSEALLGSTGGNDKIALGARAGIGVGDASNVICIGAPGLNESNSCFIGQISTTTLPGGNAVFINASGKLGLITSSRRFKEEIEPMNQASDVIYGLKPVTFRYKRGIDPNGILQFGLFGLVAEEVEKVSPDLVGCDQEGKPYTVHYEQINAMLLNEFLKGHKTVQELKKEIAALTARLNEQDSKIQKVSDRVQLRRPIQQLVSNHQ
jgi:trimeric autotransporter adhesin